MESNKHHGLVKKMYNYVVDELDIEKSLVETDIFEVIGNVSRMSEGFVPDLYYKYNNELIIGEAKTGQDFEREHSLQQYQSYSNYLNKYSEEGYQCRFIIAVPWDTSITASRIIRKMFGYPNNTVEIIVFNEMGVYKKYEKNKVE